MAAATQQPAHPAELESATQPPVSRRVTARVGRHRIASTKKTRSTPRSACRRAVFRRPAWLDEGQDLAVVLDVLAATLEDGHGGDEDLPGEEAREIPTVSGDQRHGGEDRLHRGADPPGGIPPVGVDREAVTPSRSVSAFPGSADSISAARVSRASAWRGASTFGYALSHHMTTQIATMIVRRLKEDEPPVPRDHDRRLDARHPVVGKFEHHRAIVRAGSSVGR